MIIKFFDWCGRNIETIIWFNIVFLTVSAVIQIQHGNYYPMGLSLILIAVMWILKD